VNRGGFPADDEPEDDVDDEEDDDDDEDVDGAPATWSHSSRNATTTTNNHVAGPDTTLRCPVASCRRFLLARGSDASKSPGARLLMSSVITGVAVVLDEVGCSLWHRADTIMNVSSFPVVQQPQQVPVG
jgi:hypothetical protein